ncbi:ubiquitin carboxyl-terminal hydrolase [Homalodisca vitripennis]|nr:ubiquitin carboxyl-terminal hydrolase [Homalodisca vitripennis]
MPRQASFLPNKNVTMQWTIKIGCPYELYALSCKSSKWKETSGLITTSNAEKEAFASCCSAFERQEKHLMSRIGVFPIYTTQTLNFKSPLNPVLTANRSYRCEASVGLCMITSHTQMHLTNFAPQFAGYQQHDAQELLTFLLDGLHEDLNRIQEKPYSQNEENEDEDDATLARSSWESFLRRNDSIIIDHFHGMLKSRLVCPDCEKVSIKFDTFSTLSLPLPMECERTMKVCYVPYDQSAKVVDLKVDVPKNGVINDLMMELSRVTGVRTEDMIISKVHNNHFHKFYNHDDMLREICVKEKIYMYDVPRTLAENPSVQSTILPVILCEVNDSNRSTQNKLFGTPFLLSLPPGPMLFKNFYIRICEQMTRTSEGFLKAINNVGSLPMDYESASGDSTSRSNSTTYLFKPVFVEMDSSSNVLNIDTSEDTIVQIPENYGREVLALQVERKVHKEYYNEEIPLIRDHCDTLKHSTVPTIEDCLNLFTSTEKLGTNNAWFCPRCHEKKRASKKLDLWKLPNILILHLKRFAFTEIRRGKLGIKIDYPVTGLNLSNVVANKQKENLVYDLIGVCNHYGNLTGGHYTAYCRNFNDYKWYSYDDSVVSVISPETVQSYSSKSEIVELTCSKLMDCIAVV